MRSQEKKTVKDLIKKENELFSIVAILEDLFRKKHNENIDFLNNEEDPWNIKYLEKKTEISDKIIDMLNAILEQKDAQYEGVIMFKDDIILKKKENAKKPATEKKTNKKGTATARRKDPEEVINQLYNLLSSLK